MKRILRCILPILGLGWAALQAAESPDQTSSLESRSAPTLAPYVQALSGESVAVMWQTDQPAYGWVEHGPTRALGEREDLAVHGLRAANVLQHRVVLKGLKPGAPHWYRVGFRPIKSFGAYEVDFGPEQYSEILPLRPLPAPGDPVTAVVYNDLHNGVATFSQLRRVVGDIPFDFSIFNGDCLADPGNREEVLAALRSFTQGADARSRPAFFVRGNHETRGAFARDLPDLFAWPSDRPYFAFNAGPVRWLVLDCGEDKPDANPAYSGLVDFEGFRREQTLWLKREIVSRAFRKARWRVLVHHIPIYSARESGGYHPPCRELWGELLAKARIDLALNAHTHRPAFHAANTIGNPYPIAVGGGPKLEQATLMLLEADRNRLKLRVLNAEGRDLFPAFEKHR